MGNIAAELEKFVKTRMAAQQAADAAIATATTFREIPLGLLHESKWNPRRTFEAKGLADLTASVKEKGVLVPLLVRIVGGPATPPHIPQDGHYEIVAGARRFRAAKAAGLKAVPAIVRDLTDDQALEAQVIENLQRADVHPLEEAEGYRRLLDRARYDVESLAAKVGKSTSYIYQRLKLADLAPDAKRAFLEEQITAGHAILLARLQPKQQKDLLPVAKDSGVRELVRRIEYDVHLDLGKAAFPKDDAALLKGAKACIDCPKRTGANPSLFPDVKKGDTCTDPACFHAKEQAFVGVQLKAHPGAKKLSAGYFYGNQAKGLTGWTQAGAAKCKNLVEGVVVQVERFAGDRTPTLGAFLQVCTSSRCPVHHPEYRGLREPSPASVKKQREADKQRRLDEQELRDAVVRRVYRGLAAKKPNPVFVAAAIAEFCGQTYDETFPVLCDEAGLETKSIGEVKGLEKLSVELQLAFLVAAFVAENYGGYGSGGKEIAQVLGGAGVDVKRLRAEIAANRPQKAKPAKKGAKK